MRSVPVRLGRAARYGGAVAALLFELATGALAHGGALTARVTSEGPPGRIVVEVVDPYGNPVERAEVEVLAAGGGRAVSPPVRLEPLGDGRYAGTLPPGVPVARPLQVVVRQGPEIWRGRVALPGDGMAGRGAPAAVLGHVEQHRDAWYGAAALALVANLVLLRLWWQDYAAARRHLRTAT